MIPDDAKPTILERLERRAERMARWFRDGLVVAPREEDAGPPRGPDEEYRRAVEGVEGEPRAVNGRSNRTTRREWQDIDERIGQAPPLTVAQALEAIEELRRKADDLVGQRVDITDRHDSFSLYEASIEVRVRNPAGDDHTMRFPIHRDLLGDYGGMGEDGMKRLISDVLAPHLVPGSAEDLSRVFLRAQARPRPEMDAWEVHALVTEEAVQRQAERRGVSGSTIALELTRDLIREHAGRAPYLLGAPKPEGNRSNAEYWRYVAKRFESRLQAAYYELHELREKPATHEVEELVAALERADARIRFFEQEIERQDEHNEDLLQRNVWLSERLAEVDPLYRAEVEERRKGGE